jgi:hypothetical protein
METPICVRQIGSQFAIEHDKREALGFFPSRCRIARRGQAAQRAAGPVVAE